VLSRHDFLRILQHEKRRTERSKVPLSIALFHFHDSRGVASDDVVERLRLVHDNKRETDILGYLGDDLVAVLLPDTNAQGTQRFLEKIAHRANDLAFTSTTATYPDRVFDSLAEERRDLADLDPLFLDGPSQRKGADLIKRGIDILGAATAILLLSPLMLMTTVSIAMTSPGPIIFRQVRLGRRSVPFVFYKFRSMHCNADSGIHRDHVTSIIKAGRDSTGQVGTKNSWSKLESDPRITSVGRVIRKTSIDELPQLFSVLKGDMSLVGPRPPLPYEAEVYEPWHLRRVLEVKPGITGLWQVGGRGKVSFDDMVRMDLRYIREWSLALDLKILIKTVLVVLRRDGAT
jgi:lipopolysaccharide/colanic/teichoic acid biosynthesis glycosyltransferase